MSSDTLEEISDEIQGDLVIVGGGGTTPDMHKRILEMAGGLKAKILVIPQASSNVDKSSPTADKWKEAGVGEVAILDLSDHKRAISEVMNADLVWISGGSQRRLMDSLKGTGVPEALRRHYREGGVIGGSSAGAAVMSKFMITGHEVIAGLGLWPEAMVDQHFLARRRFNRLLRAVLDRPSLIGVGIDERTAVFLHGKSFEVVGESSVLVVDARKAKTEDVATTDVVLHVLRSGMKFDWTK